MSNTLLVFGMTVLPIVFSPGPDILFISSQGLTNGIKAAFKANCGVILGYIAHSLFAAFGLAAIVVASPTLFNGLRWVGVAYIVYLAVRMLMSAMQPREASVGRSVSNAVITKGFFTSLLNPKGLLVYFAILPNFINPNGNIALQSISLSGIYIASCAIVYSGIAFIFAQISKGQYNDKKRRIGEAIAGALLALAACGLAFSS